jgi:hypothetical protein
LTKDPLQLLARRVWITKGARLSASRRLELRQTWSTRTIAFLSVYLIAASVFLLTASQDIPRTLQRQLGLASVVASLLLLVIGLVEGGQNYLVKADRLHRCAKELLQLEVQLDTFLASQAPTSTQLNDLGQEFTVIIERCPENHLPMDYEYFRCSRRKEFDISWYASLPTRLGYWARVLGPYTLAVFGPPLVFIYLVLRSRVTT